MAAIFGIVGYESMIKRTMTLHCALHFQLQRGKQTQDGSATLVIQAICVHNYITYMHTIIFYRNYYF